MDAYSLATEYLDLGYDAIPLQAGTKEAACKGWQHAAPVAQWEHAAQECQHRHSGRRAVASGYPGLRQPGNMGHGAAVGGGFGLHAGRRLPPNPDGKRHGQAHLFASHRPTSGRMETTRTATLARANCAMGPALMSWLLGP